jgi:hypothetical protein
MFGAEPPSEPAQAMHKATLTTLDQEAIARGIAKA